MVLPSNALFGSHHEEDADHTGEDGDPCRHDNGLETGEGLELVRLVEISEIIHLS